MNMVVGDSDMERIAGELIVKHGPQAARVAADRLNAMVDSNDLRGRDIWACIVRAIHLRQGTAPVEADGEGAAER
jgi:hypothetical protein